jgi:hypothetical protein
MRVTVTVPAYLEKQFEQLRSDLGLSNQDTFLHCLTNALAWKAALPDPSGPTGVDAKSEKDVYLLNAPERLKIYTFATESFCVRGEELGELHSIERGQRYGWVNFSRHSKEGVEGWENGKNGKLCEACHSIVLQNWMTGDKHV